MFVQTLQRHKLAAMTHTERIDTAAITTTETKEMNSIQHIGLTLAISANKAIKLRREMQLGFSNVLIIKYSKVCQSHCLCKDRRYQQKK
jgi:hypothetical protein